MVGVPAAPPASDVGSFSPSLAERGGSLGHEQKLILTRMGFKIKVPSEEVRVGILHAI